MNIFSLYLKESEKSVDRILKEIDDENIKSEVYSHLLKTSVNTTLNSIIITGELCKYFGSTSKIHDNLIDFNHAIEKSYVLFDHVIDKDITYNLVSTYLSSRILNDIALERLFTTKPDSINYFNKFKFKYIKGVFFEKNNKPILENYYEILDLKSNAYVSIFGSVGFCCHADKKELNVIEKFSQDFYKLTQLDDDIMDFSMHKPKENWNINLWVDSDTVEKERKKLELSCIEGIKKLGSCPEVDNIITSIKRREIIKITET